MKHHALTISFLILLSSCNSGSAPTDLPLQVDILISGGLVFGGNKDDYLKSNDVGIRNDKIVFIGNSNDENIVADSILDASGLIVTAGFIDPHTHSLGELESTDANGNLNYLFQGVTTVFNGNDGDGRVDVEGQIDRLTENGIGTNTALYIGHTELRRAVMSGENRAPTSAELEEMAELVRDGMRAGAIGFSTGLFYAPGSFSKTDEVITLARAAAEFGGIYDTHVRDESNYNIGVVAAIQEVLDIGKAADIPVHIAHIKALGVDVWGKSDEIIELINTARESGLPVTADQYPWRASGTHMRNALFPRHLLKGEDGDYLERLHTTPLMPAEVEEIRENLRRRGGADSILVVVAEDESIVGLTLEEIAIERDISPIDAAIEIVKRGSTRIASFNMNPQDIEAFMAQDWVMTSSDGNDGHPRKYASFPEKFQKYVIEQDVLSTEAFLFKSSALTADTFGLTNRGRIQIGNLADVIVFDPDTFAPTADFNNWNSLSIGVIHSLVNGQIAIRDQEYTGALAGDVLLGNGKR